jgi:hypothetical protein
MTRPEKYHVEQSIPFEQLDWRIRIEKNTKVQQKLSLSDSDLGDSFHRLFF